VIKLKEDFPKLNIVINGGIKNHDTATELLSYGLDGVMLGREAYQNPLILHNVDSTYYQQEDHHKTAQELNEAILYWIEGKLSEGVPLKYLAKHTLGLYAGQPGSKRFRRHLSENMTKNASGIDVYKDALAMIKNPTFS
jgi:tRNA-dihydrouridine synthase A